MGTLGAVEEFFKLENNGGRVILGPKMRRGGGGSKQNKYFPISPYPILCMKKVKYFFGHFPGILTFFGDFPEFSLAILQHFVPVLVRKLVIKK